MTEQARKRNDVILLLLLLSVGILSALLLWGVFGGTGEVAVVTVNGEEYAKLPLSKDTELLIEGYGGGTNRLVISEGKVYISEASCPDKVCVRTGEASEIRSIVCLPNRVTVTVEQE